ncbi:hypothetical protein BCR37DRAFT_400654 [Protomyces lactucae-debilis]|uniref:Protein kinase domain-containing protein n=1 Tax=Protomyces lactucae-debilis TaxID=2754530 RepID=A0A1Y2EZG3_PROLT|nr:uncharacterized protein BCR37DRAFT_400654 [Protomyces lactucae-debilis]ORY76960.1 hypothetical protein BCR37DRAFT_400654 [Protomyces lactucae-debilis]
MDSLHSLDKETSVIRLKNAGLTVFPDELLQFSQLELLDLSGNPLCSLPADFAHKLPKLKVCFLSDCKFVTFPKLSECPVLEMVAFKGNGMQTVPEDALPPSLRWLILTNNAITALPSSIGRCTRLEKCMLAGNQLTDLPHSMANLKRLGLLRLSANKLASLPSWLFELPSLCWLAFAGNPCSQRSKARLSELPWDTLVVQHILGEGASGVISKAKLGEKEVAVKVFKGEVTSDGAPSDEMDACIAAGSHPHLIDPLASVLNHPGGRRGLVLELVPPTYTNLGLPPSMTSCTRDNFSRRLSKADALSILRGIAAAAVHLHRRGIAHGDLYAHNILVDDHGHAFFGDFGAATLYGDWPMEKLEVKAFGWLVDDLMSISELELSTLRDACTTSVVSLRPTFVEIESQLGP